MCSYSDSWNLIKCNIINMCKAITIFFMYKKNRHSGLVIVGGNIDFYLWTEM